MSRLFAVMPPSTRNVASSIPESVIIASTTSRICHAVASSTARARCRLGDGAGQPRDHASRASARQCGANRPEKAGTK
jgi:hypothetical protein